MNSDQSESPCAVSHSPHTLCDSLEEYVLICKRCDGESDGTQERNSNQAKATKKERPITLFPNLAGFCRYLGISTCELEELTFDAPHIYSRILTVLEDEALNSGLSPALLSAYLKKRIGYEGKTAATETQLSLSFDHDIYEDGG